MSTFTYVKTSHDWRSNTTTETTRVKWHAVLLTTALAFLATAAVCLAVYFANGYEFFKASGSQYRLATAAPNAALTAAYLQDMLDGLDNLGATDGYTRLVFKADSNSVSIYRENVKALVARAEYVATLSESDLSYQYAITNLREAVSNLGTVDNGVLWVRYWPILLWGCIGLAAGLIVGFIGLLKRAEWRDYH